MKKINVHRDIESRCSLSQQVSVEPESTNKPEQKIDTSEVINEVPDEEVKVNEEVTPNKKAKKLNKGKASGDKEEV